MVMMLRPAAIVLIILGLLGVASYYFGWQVSVYISLGVMLFAGIVMAWSLLSMRLGILIVISYITFSLPFVHLLNYIDFDYDAPPTKFLWGLLANPYMFDPATIDLVGLMAAVGSCALVAGAVFSGSGGKVVSKGEYEARSMHLLMYFLWLVAAVAMFWLSAPKLTIFEAAYTESESLSEQLQFGSAWLVAHGLLSIVLVDAMVEKVRRTAVIKYFGFLLVLVFSIIWFQLLRGNREGIPFVFVAAVLFVVWGVPRLTQGKGTQQILRGMAIFFVVSLVFVSYAIGELRSTMVGGGFGDLTSSILSVVRENPTLSPPTEEGLPRTGPLPLGPAIAQHLPTTTWTAVLLTPLSVAGDDVRGVLDMKWGRTYLDFVSSAVPGFVADKLGYERPIDATRGPAWEMRFGIGGTHATVVPFMNFRMAGVMFVIFVWSWLLNKSERWLRERDEVAGLSFVALLGIAVPHWMWYGEKNIMTALIVWFALYLAYRIIVIRVQPILFRVASIPR